MKCVILAGGSGDSLWPLSRKNYPKQFMNFKEGRSLLQETVVRNMPYCDEFIIVTNEAYKNIVNACIATITQLIINKISSRFFSFSPFLNFLYKLSNGKIYILLPS